LSGDYWANWPASPSFGIWCEYLNKANGSIKLTLVVGILVSIASLIFGFLTINSLNRVDSFLSGWFFVDALIILASTIYISTKKSLPWL
jgi:hypothetical protein